MTIRLLRSISCISVSEKKREKKVAASQLPTAVDNVTCTLTAGAEEEAAAVVRLQW